MTTKYITDNYNFQTVLWDSASFLAWAIKLVWAKGWLLVGLALLAVAYGILTGAPPVLAWGAVAVKAVACAVAAVAIVVAIILTGGWACRWVK